MHKANTNPSKASAFHQIRLHIARPAAASGASLIFSERAGMASVSRISATSRDPLFGNQEPPGFCAHPRDPPWVFSGDFLTTGAKAGETDFSGDASPATPPSDAPKAFPPKPPAPWPGDKAHPLGSALSSIHHKYGFPIFISIPKPLKIHRLKSQAKVGRPSGRRIPRLVGAVIPRSPKPCAKET